MNNRLILIFLLSLVFLESCMLDAPKNARKTLLNTNLTGTNITNGPVQPAGFAADEVNPYWFDSQKIIGTMSINMNTQNIYYLRGQKVHEFLSSTNTTGGYYYQNSFCIKADFGSPTLYQPLWVRAIPLAITNFTTKSLERVLRVDIPSEIDNTASCNQGIGAAVAYAPGKICLNNANCFGKISTTSISIPGIPIGKLDISSANLQIDLQSNSTSTTSLCSNSSCSAKGFDCCIQGQCVKDATIKSSATNNPTEYNQSMAEYAINPLSFINWPNIFYICSNISHTPPPTPPTTPAPTPLTTAQDRVKQYSSDYQCINDVQSLIGYAQCLPGTNITAYNAIKLKLARSCGCNAIDSEVAIKCPDWGVRPLYATSVQNPANIVDFYCYTPQPISQMGPITNLNVSVSNRTAPHRLYSAQGMNYDLITNIPTTIPPTVQEGVAFSYVDEFNKMSPYNGSFNINSVLGSMSIDLNHALPAKSVIVEVGKSYILTATSGYYSPCPKCAKDNWYSNFFSFAPSQKGVGLKSSGYSTTRDSYSNNVTLGNYEDTNFGRACFVPVTMLPFANKKEGSLQVQRQNRLTTQTAFYINGYQRDWFGFNQGALISSFDGVTWFAIGNGRRVTATTTKLFLAINAAFVDLADKTDTVVNIVPDTANNIVASFDFDTTAPDNDVKQNQGATCQRFHQCTTDTDCITQLGWEYVCADVTQYKSSWPTVNSDADEIVNNESNATLFEILSATIDVRNPTRCVYRGAGAPCKGDTTSLNAINKKIFTCAPNFYCAAGTSNSFNSELVRSPNEPNNMLFGFDANILGRPVNYVTGNQSLPAEVITNLKYNATSISPLTTDIGLCRPGKSLDSTFTEVRRHYTADPSKRTDYISQIANCDSNYLNTANRFVNCPVIETDPTLPNYLNLKTGTVLNEQVQQNACGGEAVYKPTVGSSFVSAFKFIEGLTLPNNASIFNPIIAKDACLRRAGSVCHTDLECSPNIMQEQTASTLPLSAFGGTEAEQLYWKESLICGQGAVTPLVNTPDYNKYQLNQNRCCRDIGKDFTMFTEGADNGTANIGLKTNKGSFTDPTLAGRYSRYTVSPTAFSIGTSIPAVTTTSEPAAYQWRVMNETGSRTCCGGGYVRKFADGTHDWNIKGRLNFDTNNFNCLNFRSPLPDPFLNLLTNTNIKRTSYESEYSLFCSAPDAIFAKSGCLQIPYPTSSGANEFTIIAPTLYTSMGVLNTGSVTNPMNGGVYTTENNSNAPYQPVNYYSSQNGSNLRGTNSSKLSYGVSYYLPVYIDQAQIQSIIIHYFDANGAEITGLTSAATPIATTCTTPLTYSLAFYDSISTSGVAPANYDESGYCIDNVTNSARPILNIKAKNQSSADATIRWNYASLEISFITLEASTNTAVVIPGNPNYYLTKLGRLELLGIPQITYEPLYCTNDQNKLVPGIFKTATKVRADLNAKPTYTSNSLQKLYSTDTIPASFPDEILGIGNGEKKFVFEKDIDHAAVFSSKDFTCCTPLGMTPKNGVSSGCCSNFSSSIGGKQICRLPIDTDLNVYFNRFVSNEGIGTNLPGAVGLAGLVDSTIDADSDFNMYTGEPKLRASTADKIYALGIAYCDKGKVTTGGAFGKFPPQPNNGTFPANYTPADYPTSIVDSIADDLSSVDLTKYIGKPGFDRGVRWNHHFYCRD